MDREKIRNLRNIIKMDTKMIRALMKQQRKIENTQNHTGNLITYYEKVRETATIAVDSFRKIISNDVFVDTLIKTIETLSKEITDSKTEIKVLCK
jgi:endonuclease III